MIGGLGGALVGNAVKRGGAGLLIGGVGGALVGREIGKSGCHRTRTVYYDSGSRGGSASAPARAAPVRQVYYDHMGNPVASGEVRDGTFQQVTNVSTASSGTCRNATISYYDERGRLNQRPVQICPR